VKLSIGHQPTGGRDVPCECDNNTGEDGYLQLSHHKALIKEFPVSDENSPRELQTTESMFQHILKGQLDLLNYANKHSYCYERWKKVATFMIRKDQNSSVLGGLEPSPWSEVEISYTPLYRQRPFKPRTIWWPPRQRRHDAGISRRTTTGNNSSQS
jgi:hypothetical protein